MLLSCITLAFQVVCAKYCGEEHSPGRTSSRFCQPAPARMDCRNRNWPAFVFVQAPADGLPDLPDPFLITLLAIGTTFYVR